MTKPPSLVSRMRLLPTSSSPLPKLAMCFFFKRLSTFVRKASATTPSLGAPHCLAQTNRSAPQAFGLRLAYFQVFFEVGVVTAFREAERGLRAFEFLFSVVDERIRRSRRRLRRQTRGASGVFTARTMPSFSVAATQSRNVSQTLQLIRRVFDRDIGNSLCPSPSSCMLRVRSDCV